MQSGTELHQRKGCGEGQLTTATMEYIIYHNINLTAVTEYITSSSSWSFNDTIAYVTDMVVPQNPEILIVCSLTFLLGVFFFLISLASLCFCCAEEREVTVSGLLEDFKDETTEQDSMEDTLNKLDELELYFEPEDFKERRALALERETLEKAYKDALEKLNDLDKIRNLDGDEVEFRHIIHPEWRKLRIVLFFFGLMIGVVILFACVDTTSGNFSGYIVSEALIDTYTRSCTEEESTVSKWINWAKGTQRVECTWDVRVTLQYYYFRKYFYNMYLLAGLEDYVHYMNVAYLLNVVNMFVVGFLMLLFAEAGVTFHIKITSNILHLDLRPDAMRLMNIRHKDPKMSVVTETTDWLLLVRRLFMIRRKEQYVISYELFCQLASPNHWAYGVNPDDVVEKMSHSAQFFATINVDRHVYHFDNPFENTVRVARYRHLSRMLSFLPDF